MLARMTPRRALLMGVLVLLLLLSAVALAVRSCASPDCSLGADPGALGELGQPTGEPMRVERRRVRERGPAVDESAAVGAPETDRSVDGLDSAPGPPVDAASPPACEFVIAVIDADGRRIPGVDVTLQGDGQRGRGLSGARGLLDLDRLADGEGALHSGVTDSSGIVRIMAPLSPRMRFRATSDIWHGEARASQLTGPGPIEVQMTVVPGFRISGRVVRDDRTAVTGGTVYIGVPLPGLAARRPRSLENVRTDGEGRFRSTVHPVPETRIVECYVMASTVAGTPRRFPVTAGAMEGVELVVPRGGVVRGRCVDEEGKPLAGVRVRGIKPGTGEITFSGPRGRFAMKIPGRGGGLVFFLEGRVQTGLQDLRGAPEGTDIGDVLIPRGGVLAGRLVDPAGNPLVGATVWIVEPISEHAAATLQTGPAGRFRSDLVGPGTHHLFVRYRRDGEPSGPLSSFRFDGFTAGTTDATVVMQPASWTTLEVRDPNGGEPLAFETGAYTLRRVDGRPYVAAHDVFETKGETRSEFPIQFPGPGTYDIELEVSTTGAVDRRRIVVGDEPPDSIVLTPR
jgi:hypothetical protein